jgi:hypothetical protein
MPKLIPVPDSLSKPFWDAVNQRRLVSLRAPSNPLAVDGVLAADELVLAALRCLRQAAIPAAAGTCQVCNSAASLTWKDGLVNRLVPPDELMSWAIETAEMIAANSDLVAWISQWTQ